MKVYGLLVAVFALVVLAGLVYWSNKTEEAKAGKPDANAPPKILDLKEDTVAKISIDKTGAQPVVVARGQDGEWKLTSPEALPADQDAVKGVLTTVSSLDSSRLLEDKVTDKAKFGLDHPELTVVVTEKDGKSKKLEVGDETPTGSNYYAMLDGDPRLFTVASYNKTGVEKTAWDLRDKRLLPFNSDKLSRVELIAKGQTVEIGKNNRNEWQIVAPQPMRADGGQVESLISDLRDAKMETDPATVSNSNLVTERFNKGARIATAKVTDAAGVEQMEVRKTPEGDYYARSSAVDGIHKITNSVAEGMDKGVDDLRNHKLFDFGFSEPNRIEFKDGDKTTVFEKSGDKWMRAGKAVDAVALRSLIDKLRDLAAKSFPQHNFTAATVEWKVTWDGGQRTDHVLMVKSGDAYYAKRQGEPSIYELGVSDVDTMLDAARHIQDEAAKTAADKKKS